MSAQVKPGTRLGHYEIRSKIGEGGMGEVYLADDDQLHRKVALKVLLAEVAANGDRLRRFKHEAIAAAALNHPHIAHIYEVGESQDLNFIAMEFIDGATLSEKIHREKTPLIRLLKYLNQVAEGLAKAHAAGIVHRDLKPDNIMITRDDYAKILDFGLAKLVEPQKTFGPERSDSSEVVTAMLPQQSIPGMIMGTVGYMSPEQAEGRGADIDHRSDIFSFGCILFEAATGRKAFAGKDLLDSLHKIVHAPTPQISETNPSAPAELQRIVRRCLAKDPEKRYQSIKEVAIELEEILEELKRAGEPARSAQTSALADRAEADLRTDQASQAKSTGGGTPGATVHTEPAATSSAEYLVGQMKRHKTSALVALVVLIVVGAGSAFAIYKISNRSKAFNGFQPGKIERLTGTGNAWGGAISPDGKFVAYVSGESPQSLWVRDVATNSDVQIAAPAEVRYRGLSFSPDGNYVYYTKWERGAPLGVLYQVPKLGGTPKKLLAGVDSGVTFSPDGKRMAFLRAPDTKESALLIANADGTGAQKLFAPASPDYFPSTTNMTAPAWSLDGNVIACALARADASISYETVVSVSVADGTMKPLTAQRWDDINHVAWDTSRSLLLTARERRGTSHSQIWRLSYPEGEVQKITEGLTAYYYVSLSADSRLLVTTAGDEFENVWTAPFNASVSAPRQITSGRRDGYCGVAWTSDGRILYISRKINNADLWLMNSNGGDQKQLTDDEQVERYPSFSPDGRYLVFDLIRKGTLNIWRADADGGNLKQLTNGTEDVEPNCSPDGKWVVYRGTDKSLWKVPIDGGQSVRLTDKAAAAPAVSPDGKAIACYYRDEASAPWKLALVPAEGGPPLKQFDAVVTPRNWLVLRWTPDGRSLLYVDDDRNAVSNIWAQPADGGAPKQLTDFKSDLIYTFDLSRDGKELVMSRGRDISDVVLISNAR